MCGVEYEAWPEVGSLFAIGEEGVWLGEGTVGVAGGDEMGVRGSGGVEVGEGGKGEVVVVGDVVECGWWGEVVELALILAERLDSGKSVGLLLM